MLESIWGLLLVILILVISAIPLNLAVKLLGGQSSILKVILVNFLVGIATFFLQLRFSFWGGILSFIALLVIYSIMFKIGILRSFFAWLLQGVIVVAFTLLLMFFGINLL